MNKKAQIFQEYLQEKNITCFQVQEVPNDELNTVVFRSSIEVEGQQLPTLVITDSSIYTMIRVRVANQALKEGNEVALIKAINKNTSAFTFFDYGHVYGNGQSDDQHNVLSSVGLGIRSTINQYCSASLILGIPLQREFSAEKVSKTRLHFIVSGQF